MTAARTPGGGHDSMAHRSSTTLLVLTALRLSAFADAPRVAAWSGLSVDAVGAELEARAEQGLVRYREGRITGWMLTGPGRAAGQRLLVEELESVGARPAVDDAYRRFLVLNQPLLHTCTDWQMRDAEHQIVNNHTDAAYDKAVVDRLAGLHDGVVPVVHDLAAVFERFGGYAGRFGVALERVRAGDGDWFTRPTIDSFHTVWFELHEHLLATLGIDRAGERAG